MSVPDLRTRTVAEIVARHPASARVLQAHRIDFCCRGERTVAEALAGRAGAREDEVLAEIEGAIHAPAAQAEPAPVDLSVPALVARIIDRHHAYLRRALPSLLPLVSKVARVHGDHDPALAALDAEVRLLAGALEPHLDEEERDLFPLLMARGADRARVRAALARMRSDHLAVGEALGRIRDLAHGFEAPPWACASYRLALAELEDLETDLLRHVHLENHVLGPKAAA
jgi:regulator of cell morphogenesis and NO signaling